MSNSPGFGASGGLRPRQHTVISDEPWFQTGSHDTPLDGSYSDCLPGVSTLPAMRNPSCASYVSHDAPSNYGASSPLYPPKRISDGESFWSSSPTDHSFSSSTNSPSNWNSFQGITDPFGFTEHIHGLPNVPLADINLHSNGLSSLSLDYPIYSPTPACGSFSSAGAIDMMESMALKEEIANNIWTTSMCDQGMPAPTFALDSPLFSNAMKAEVTVSPKQLKIHPTPTPTSSVGSVHTSFFAGGDSDSATMAHESPYLEPSSSEGTSRRHRRDGTQQNRKQLPDKPTHHRYVPILPDDRSRSVDKGEYTAKAKPAAKAKTPRFKPARQQRSCNIAVPAAPNSSDERSAKDDFLVKSKLAGMTYKEIRRKGGFTEAESTLRGRFRTLTKNKEARVRKPEWSDIDDQLLQRAVRKLGRVDASKIPWKQVASYIVEHGGSYHFGNTTCRRRWDTLVAEAELGGGGRR